MEWIITEFNKCDLLCANCHREIHSPQLSLSNVKELIKNLDDDILIDKIITKPKCVDCGCEINYSHKRCRPCSDLAKRTVDRPTIDVLREEIRINTQEWGAKKYGVTRTTIRRWLNKM